jgi:hypothetical protein
MLLSSINVSLRRKSSASVPPAKRDESGKRKAEKRERTA